MVYIHSHKHDDFYLFSSYSISGNPKARVPYKSIKDSQVCGFPAGLSFGAPSSFSTSDLKIILEKADDISFCKIEDMYTHLIWECTYIVMCMINT